MKKRKLKQNLDLKQLCKLNQNAMNFIKGGAADSDVLGTGVGNGLGFDFIALLDSDGIPSNTD